MRLGFLLLLLFACLPAPLCAIDNPDAPDLVGEFLARSVPYEKAAGQVGGGGRDAVIAYREYQDFLDRELNRAYRLLMSKLSVAQQAELRAAQRRWIEFRDVEFQFINGNWTRERFGSSAVISRGTYRSTVVKERVLQLLYYAKSYL